MKSDVYGFGVVLLEMLSGLRALDTTRPSGHHNLVDFAKPFLSDRRKLARLMDPRLEGRYPSKAAQQAAQLTVRCLAGDPKSRPSMKEVVETLEHIEVMTSRPRESKSGSPRPAARGHDPSPAHGRSPVNPRHEGAGRGALGSHHAPGRR